MKNGVAQVSRRDGRKAVAWVLANRFRTLLVGALMAGAGVASVLGCLRWDQPYARWSFALLCWAGAGFLIVVSARRRG